MNAGLSTYLITADNDCSPADDSFSYPYASHKAYLADFYTTSLDYSQYTLPDSDFFFQHPVTSVELSAGFNSTNTGTILNPDQHACKSAIFSQMEQSFPFDMPMSPCDTHSSASGTIRRPSPTPSLCDNNPPPASLNSETLNKPISTGGEPEQKRPRRKRVRQRLNRNLYDIPFTSVNSSSLSKRQEKWNRTSRLPHNQVERKYREGLNGEIERLRKAVPTLPQRNKGALVDQPKLSKAMVLGGAIEYIRIIERERDVLSEENEKLGGRAWRKAMSGRKTKSRPA